MRLAAKLIGMCDAVVVFTSKPEGKLARWAEAAGQEIGTLVRVRG